MTQLGTFEGTITQEYLPIVSDIFNKRPPKPKYPFTWDGETVLYFLRKITGNYIEGLNVVCLVGYKRSQILEWIVWQKIHLSTHLLFPIWRRLFRGAKSPTPFWSFTYSQVTTNSVYARRLIPIFKGVMFGRMRKVNFLLPILNHLNQCLRQQSLDGWDKFLQ